MTELNRKGTVGQDLRIELLMETVTREGVLQQLDDPLERHQLCRNYAKAIEMIGRVTGAQDRAAECITLLIAQEKCLDNESAVREPACILDEQELKNSLNPEQSAQVVLDLYLIANAVDSAVEQQEMYSMADHIATILGQEPPHPSAAEQAASTELSAVPIM